MKVRKGFVSNSSSSSFIINEERLEKLKKIREVIGLFLDDYENDGGYFWYNDDKSEISLSTESGEEESILTNILLNL